MVRLPAKGNNPSNEIALDVSSAPTDSDRYQMRLSSAVIGSLVVTGLIAIPSPGIAQDLHQDVTTFTVALTQTRQNSDSETNRSTVRVLSDHSGSATALTARQKQEIRDFVRNAQGRTTLICTAASLAGQRESMYRVVRLRAELVCDFAKSLNASLVTSVQEKTTRARQYNGRVVVVSK